MTEASPVPGATSAPAEDPSAPSAPGPDAQAVAAACYRLLLGREPENAAVVAANARFPSYEALLANFLTSEEHVRRAPPHFAGLTGATAPRIDVDVTPDALAAMFERIRAEWSGLGEVDPYWSVLTDESYRGQAIGESQLRSFYESGYATAGTIDAFADRCGVTVAADWDCLEFGCGVGRVTIPLARRFRRVIAVDVSAGNLELCRRALAGEGLENVETRLIASPQDVAALPGYDFLFSTIVFQHNPPPVQRYLLEVLLSKIATPGGYLFQVPTHTQGYRFEAEEYLRTPPAGMEMHSLPMAHVMRLLAARGLPPLEVLMDAWTGLYGSHTFFGVGGATAG